MPRVPPPCSGRERCCPRGAPGREARQCGTRRAPRCSLFCPGRRPKITTVQDGLPCACARAPSSFEPVTQDARSLPRSPQERRIALEAVVGTDEGQSGGQPDPNRADGGEALHRICRIAQLVPVLCPSGSTHAALPLARARARAHTHTHSFSRARARARSALRLRLATRARSVVASTSTRTTRAPSSGA
jgi:hypothetical protein